MTGTTTRRVIARLAPGYARPGDLDNPYQGLASAIARYRVMAFVVGTGLLILVLIGMPLQYGATIPQVAEVVGVLHGILYIVYLLSAVDLARRARFTLLQMLAMIAAGFLPFLAFVIEHRVVVRLRAMAVLDGLMPAPAASPGPAMPAAAETDLPAAGAADA